MDYSKLSDEELDKLYKEAMAKKEAASTPQKSPTIPNSDDEMVVHENHPNVPLTTRLGFKNLLRDKSKNGLEVLQQKLPGMDIRVDESGKFQVKNKDEHTWKYIDKPMLGEKINPLDQLINLVDDPKDLLDIGGDLVKGAVDTTGTALSGIAGFFGGGGAGALPAAIAGGAGTSAATEGVRQFLAKQLGYEKDYDKTAITREGLIGAGSPLLLGTGATAKHAAKFAPEASEAFLNAQRGVIGRGSDFVTKTVAPEVAHFLSGAPIDAMRHAAKNLDTVAKESKKAIPGDDLVKGYADELHTAVKTKTKQAGEKIDEAATNPKVIVDMTEAEKPLDDLVSAYKSEYEDLVSEVGETAAKKDAVYKDYKTVKKQVTKYGAKGYTLDGKGVRRYKKRSKTLTNIDKSPEFKASNLASEDLQKAFKQTNANIKEQLERTVEGRAFNKANDEFADIMQKKDLVKEYFGQVHKSKNKMESTLSNLGSKARVNRADDIRHIQDAFGVNLNKMADELQAVKLYAKPSYVPISRGGTTSTSRSMLGITGLGQLIASDGLTKKIMQANRIAQGAARGGIGQSPAVAPTLGRALLSNQLDPVLNPWAEFVQSKISGQ